MPTNPPCSCPLCRTYEERPPLPPTQEQSSMSEAEEEVELCPTCHTSDCPEEVVACSHRRGHEHFVHQEDACPRCLCCEDYCECFHCDNCGDRYSLNDRGYCEACEGCEDCCECFHCDVCGGIGGCDCEHSTGVFVSNPLKFHSPTSSKKGYKRNPVCRFVSLEIEVAKTNNARPIREVAHKWSASIVNDSSLPSTGFEINTAPAKGDALIQQLDDWCSAFRATGAAVSRSCGVHVHVDARDVTWSDAMKVFTLYQRMEAFMFGLVAPSRKQSNYCIPVAKNMNTVLRALHNSHKTTTYDLTAAKRQLMALLYPNIRGRDIAVLKRDKYGTGSSHYWAMNVHSWFYRKTFEFRHHHGTLMFTKLRNWALLCAGLVDYAVRHSWAEIEELPSDALNGLVSLAPDEECKSFVVARWNHFNPESPLIPGGKLVDAYAEI